MNAFAAPAHAAAQAPASSRPLGGAWLRLAVFATTSAFAALEYASLLGRAPRARALWVVAAVTLGGAALQLLAGRARPRTRRALAAAAVLLTALLALLAAGVPAHLLAPGGWPALGRHLGHGVSALGSWLWPYTGHDRWAERAVLLVLPAVLTAAAALCFWPSARAREARRTFALVMLVALYVAGAANTPAHLDGLRGVVLVTLIAAWLWLPELRIAQAGRAARWLLACVLLALLARPLLTSTSSWIDYREPASASQLTASFQWDQQYGPIPWPRTSATMFEVLQTRPSLLRVTSLDRFDGIRFLRSASPPGITRLDLPPRRLDRGVRTGTVSVAGLRSRLLVGGGGVALGARWLGSGTPALRREADGTVAAPRTVGGGGIYQVSTYVPRATPARLRAAPRGFPRVYLPYAQFELPGRGASGLSHPNLLLEEHSAPASGALIGPADPGKAPGADATTAARIADSPYGGMYALAQRLAHGAHSSYEVARRIQLFLLRSYGYSEHVARARYPLEAFLFSQGAGYCQQFSGAMTLMLRMEGIPARVGAGFKPSVYDARTGGWQVRALDAHAWVEVFFTGFGWVTFDPTPSTPSIRAPGEDAISKALIVSGSSPRPAHGSRTGAGFARARAARAGGQFPLLGALLGGAGLLVLAALGSAAMLSHARLRRGLCGEADGAVAELRRALGALARGSSPARRRPMPATRDPGSLLGQPPPPTLAALERRLRERGRDSAGDYLAALGRSRYAPPGGGPAPSPRGRAALRRALTAGAGWRTRLRVLALMPPGGARRDGR